MAPDPDGRPLTPVRLTIAAAVLIVVAALVTFLIVRSTDTEASPGPATPAPTATTATPNDPAPSAGETYESACGLRGGSLQEPTQQPADLTFERVDGWAYPISKSAGPGRRDPQGAWSCYARTPMGAVVASYTINARLLLASDFEGVVRAQTVPGIGQETLLSNGQDQPQGITDTKGFVLESYSNDDAVISLYIVDGGQGFTCSVEVQWRDGDWKIRLQADGSSSSGCVENPPTRYVPWGDR